MPTRPVFSGAVRRHRLGPPARAALQSIVRRHDSAGTAVLLTLYAMMLAQHGSGPDLVIGMPARTTSAEGQPAFRGDGGDNLLPIRVRVDEHQHFGALVSATGNMLSRAATRADVSVEDLPPPTAPGSSSRWWNPWLRHTLDVRGPESQRPGLVLDGRPVQPLPAAPAAAVADLHLTVQVRPNDIELEARFSTEAHSAADIKAFLDRFAHLLRHVQDHTPTSEPFLSEADRTLIAETNATSRVLPSATVLGLVLDRAGNRSETLAVDGTTYGSLVAAAAAVRDRLAEAGVGPGTVVGVDGDRGANLSVAMLAIWLAGAAYLPIGANAPAPRTRQQLEAAGVTVVVRAGTPGTSPIPPGPWQTLDIGLIAAADCQVPAAALRSVAPVDTARADGFAYVLFTSGSTGRPKGVSVPHRALANLVIDMAARLSIRPGDKVLWSTAITFDISALELWATLAAGAHVRTVADSALLDPEELLRLVEREDIRIIQGTPTLWQHLLADRPPQLRGRRILVGGEPLPAALAEQLIATGAEVHNMYGPTETTIWSTTAVLSSPVPQPVPIGRPIANTRVYVLDQRGRPVFPGLAGELCIAGLGLAAGYLNDPALTNDRFVIDPVLARRYRTGDRVRQLPDGTLEFLGRDDRQVKIRGHRIELAEVEAVLSSHPRVGAAAVVTEQDPSGRLRLAAVVTDSGGAGVLVPQLHQHAGRLLPRAAIPARVLVLPALPATPHGKVDYSAVRTIMSAGPRTSAPPQDPLLPMLIRTWQTELDKAEVAASDDFFHCGGNARQALALTRRLRRSIGPHLPFDAVFTAPTPEAMCRLLTVQEGK
jgi:amino acid adenylation domain-containing protein